MKNEYEWKDDWKDEWNMKWENENEDEWENIWCDGGEMVEDGRWMDFFDGENGWMKNGNGGWKYDVVKMKQST